MPQISRPKDLQETHAFEAKCHFGYILCRIRSQYHFRLWGEEPRNNFGKIIVDLLLLGR